MQGTTVLSVITVWIRFKVASWGKNYVTIVASNNAAKLATITYNPTTDAYVPSGAVIVIIEITGALKPSKAKKSKAVKKTAKPKLMKG